MAIVLKPTRVRMAARNVAEPIRDARVAAWFEKLVFERLMSDERNFRPATKQELSRACALESPGWPHGEALVVPRLRPAALRRARQVANRLADACKLAASAPSPAFNRDILAAQRFLSRIDTAGFGLLARNTLRFSRSLMRLEEQRNAEIVCPEGEVAATEGRTWRRLRSISELRATGRAFGNCLARTGPATTYGNMLLTGASQFWVLYDPAGIGLIVAMLSLGRPPEVLEVKGPKNTAVSPNAPDLVALKLALAVVDRALAIDDGGGARSVALLDQASLIRLPPPRVSGAARPGPPRAEAGFSVLLSALLRRTQRS